MKHYEDLKISETYFTYVPENHTETMTITADDDFWGRTLYADYEGGVALMNTDTPEDFCDAASISASIYKKVSDCRRKYETEYNNIPHYVVVPEWVWNWLRADAEAMGAYIEMPEDNLSVIEYMGMAVIRDNNRNKIEEIDVF